MVGTGRDSRVGGCLGMAGKAWIGWVWVVRSGLAGMVRRGKASLVAVSRGKAWQAWWGQLR